MSIKTRIQSWLNVPQAGSEPPSTWQTFGNYGGYNNAGIPVNTTTSGDQFANGIVMDAAGNFVVVWSGDGPGDADGVFFQRFDEANESGR